MSINIAINGYGRIGRNILRCLFENNLSNQINLVAINELAPIESIKHLTQYDSIHGKFSQTVNIEKGDLRINDHSVKVFCESKPERLPWKQLNIDLVLECTGRFLKKENAAKHFSAGAKKVLLSAPSCEADTMIVYGVNQHSLEKKHRLISNASCTTNCLAPLAKILHEEVGISQGMMTTIHAYTCDQQLHDCAQEDLYRARAAAHSMIPTKTGAAMAVGAVLPELDGKIQGMAVRVPTANVSLVDFHFLANEDVTREAINSHIQKAADIQMKDIVSYNCDPLVSVDFNHSPYSCNFDASQTVVNGRWVKVMAWYDNEWGFANRMLDVASFIDAEGHL